MSRCCKNCKERIDDNLKICPVCGICIRIYGRDPWLAAGISIIPGLGQIYNGEIFKGTLFILTDIVLIMAIIILIMISILLPTLWKFTLFIIIMGILFWAYNIYDAYNNAKSW